MQSSKLSHQNPKFLQNQTEFSNTETGIVYFSFLVVSFQKKKISKVGSLREDKERV